MYLHELNYLFTAWYNTFKLAHYEEKCGKDTIVISTTIPGIGGGKPIHKHYAYAVHSDGYPYMQYERKPRKLEKRLEVVREYVKRFENNEVPWPTSPKDIK